jgi:hypothetical protein
MLGRAKRHVNVGALDVVDDFEFSEDETSADGGTEPGSHLATRQPVVIPTTNSSWQRSPRSGGAGGQNRTGYARLFRAALYE